MTLPRRTIEEFGLERNTKESYYLYDYIFLVPFVGPVEESDFISRQIDDPNDRNATGLQDPYGLAQYAIGDSKKVYVIFSAFLEALYLPSGRKTEMRLWEMVAANWVHAGNTPESLRYLAVSDIVNVGVRTAMDLEWHNQTLTGERPFGTPHQRMLTITRASSSNTWDNNQFVRVGLRVAQSLSSSEKTLTLEKVHLIQAGLIGRHMVMEYKNGDAGQEIHRDKLIHTLLPMTNYNLLQKEQAKEAGQDWERIVFLPPKMQPGRK